MAKRLLRLRTVLDRTGANTTDIYKWMREGTFPKSVPIGARTVGWPEHEVEAWIERKIAARDNGKAPARRPGPGRGRFGSAQPTGEAA